MKDETVDTGSQPFDDFDLDSFLRENNFLSDEDKKGAEAGAGQPDKQPGRRTASRRSALDKADETAKTDVTNKTDKAGGTGSRTASTRVSADGGTARTASARTKAEEDAAIGAGSTSSSARASRGGRTGRSTADASAVDAADADTRSTRGSVRSVAANSTASDSPAAGTTASNSPVAGTTAARTRRAKKTEPTAADPNATMSYQALGEDYPEIPLVGVGEDKGDAGGASGKTARRSRVGTGASPSPTSRSTRAAQTAGAARDSNAGTLGTDVFGAALASAGETVAKSSSKTRSTIAPAAVSAALPAAQSPAALPAGPAPAALPAASALSAGTSAAPAAAHPGPSNRNNPASRRGRRSDGLADPLNFQEAHFADSSYRIRGGGTRHNRPSPLMIIFMAVVIIAGGSVLAYGLNRVFVELLVEKPPEVVVTLTASETRTAIDSEMPRLFDYINGDANAAYAILVDAGQNVVFDDNVSSIRFDATATGNKVVHLSPSVDAAILEQGYHAGGLNAYDFNELQRSFNGAWVLDILHGDKGAFIQVDYVNFASISLDNELQQLRERQELTGENSAVDSQESDDYGNTYVRGYTVIDETRYYWEVIGIPFSENYSGQDRRKLPDTAVFVRCRIAAYDFYGAGELPSDDGQSDDEPPADGGEGGGEE